MKFSVKPTDSTKIATDMIVVFAGDSAVFSHEASVIDQVLHGDLADVSRAEGFDGNRGSTQLVYTHGGIAAPRVLLVGLGKANECTMVHLLEQAAVIGRKAKKIHAKRIAIAMPFDLLNTFSIQVLAQGMVEGLSLGTYEFNRHKSKETQEKEHHIDDVVLLVPAGKLDAAAYGKDMGEIVSRAVVFARDLVNEPPSYTTPTHLGNVAKSLAKGRSEMTCDVLGKSDMETLGMGGILGIARGSDEEPKFIKLSYRGSGRKTLCLVGKGITFDTGGLSLKPSDSMETMKLDMAGAAVILGIFSVLPLLKPKATIVGLISATENMPGSSAIKPGDVVSAMNGKTIEILNTDAEGRVVLADALSYAVEKVKPDALVDLATLTGACMVALGEDIAGLFANTPALCDALKKSAGQAGERVWELPLACEYKEILKSTVADIKNISGKRYGGAINGALFLQEFVPDTVPWAHLDIAGPAFAEKEAPLTPKGGTGFGVRMLINWLLQEK
ncbi:leucyl aminopeptidase [Candidatus Gottesmanbacteria bacterium]|nr:leucyl aminopeptidase [Candidatus Gottesmanbacteria bacterium]